jgi:quercetin dioxygenase-like cupin family protein
MSFRDEDSTPAVRTLTALLVVFISSAFTTSHAEELKSFEPIIAAGNYHVPIFENDRVRVLQVEIMPGETVPFHQHGTPSVFVTPKVCLAN